MNAELVNRVRKLSQAHAYTSIQMHEGVARKAGISGTDHKYLGFFLEKGAMTAGELAILSGLTTGAVTGLIDRFEKRNLVSRELAPEDRRKVIIQPDRERIMNLLAPLYEQFRKKTEALMTSLSDTELKIIESYFVRAIEIMNETTDALNKQ